MFTPPFRPRLVLRVLALLAVVTPGFAASPAWLTAHDAEILPLVARMTLAEKVGQMTQPDASALKDPSEITTYALGSVLSGGSTDPVSGNTLDDWAAHYAACQQAALQTRLAIPLLYGVDAVHGHNNVLGATLFPHNIGLGCTRDPALVRRIAEITAREVRATGIQWTFAPCVTVPRDIRWGRTYEGFSESPALVAELGLAALLGLQGERLDGPAAVVGCAKHFIGDGGTTYHLDAQGRPRLDQGDTRVHEATLRAIHLAGYPAAIDAGVGTIMPSYSSWNGVKCSGSKALLTDLLKTELGFAGLVISDYNAIDQLLPAPPRDTPAPTGGPENASGQVRTEHYKQCIEISINAGMDMVMVTDRFREFTTLLQELVNEGRVPMARIDDAVTRILRVKFAFGLQRPGVALAIDPTLRSDFGSAAHRAVAREAVRKSLVLLKNQNRALPLRRNAARIHVTGQGADDLGMQCGGWTIDWQGRRGKPIPGGVTILSALRRAAGPDTVMTHSARNPGPPGVDATVVVVGEAPYAEGYGDTRLPTLTDEDAAVVAQAHATGAPVVLVILSGRPLVLGAALDQADAVVAAWLPGSEGDGVADVLFGDAAPTGKLSFAWPLSADQIPLGHERAALPAPAFPFGFGLTYAAP